MSAVLSDIGISTSRFASNRATQRERRSMIRSYLESSEAQSVWRDLSVLFPWIFRDDRSLRSQATNTERAYHADQEEYAFFCAEKGYVPLEWTERSWLEYLDWINKQPTPSGGRRAYSTIERKAFSVGDLFLRAGRPSPTHMPFHKPHMRKIARACDRRPERAKPLYGVDVHRLIAGRDGSTLSGKRNKAIHGLGSELAFRAVTIVSVQIESLEFDSRGIVVTYYDQKTRRNTRPERKGRRHTNNHRSCLPCILRDLVDALREIGYDEGPLIRPIDRWGHVGTKALSVRSITPILQQDLARAGVAEPYSYTSHSYRRGVVKTLMIAKKSDAEIMQVTDHRSRRGLAPYTEDFDPWRNSPDFSVLECVIAASKDPTRGFRHETFVPSG